MSHILVKWVEDEKWDVYPVSALADADVAFRLISQQGCIKQLRRTVHRVSWKEGAPPALAELLAFGNPQQLEKKRARLVSEAAAQSDLPTENINSCSTCAAQVKQLVEENEALRAEVERMKRTAEERDHVAEAAKLVKRLRKALGNVETKTQQAAEPVVACPKRMSCEEGHCWVAGVIYTLTSH
ncbi:uncharacterized protein LOC119430948 [Dermacentor silvarum]|uniref:uncharacterized protein LOC119430948 n=1 Tax=Dermacentor silvarum TaxID=543639 RepID=UPI00189A6B17|nr:uncharacterized protein LOC119430948 [Dermacentor silvarum]